MNFASLIPILLSLLGRGGQGGLSPDIEKLIKQLLDQLIPKHDTPVPVVIDVTKAQEKLKALGFDPGPIDGKYGKMTKAAVTAYQTERGLTVDGLIGQVTYASLMGETA